MNILVYAFREDCKDHEQYHTWLIDRLRGDEPVGYNGVIDSNFVRIVTQPKIFQPPSEPETAFTFLRDVRSAPVSTLVQEGPRHWEIFERLCLKAGARANLVPDAYIAALAMENGATLYTADRGFARFPGLRRQHPLEDI
ncbi:type II toxin-antitoxin system VapC family toxin [Streptomyces sp. Li-HN-5-11]|uniref:type II toxin-antitoxin system VapC family toxin n=1 Tax=Streptomyces sp. Li-HN-5-11 TaxID=3075432 RepID=UPI0028AB7983|nr:type II toxin-antitoxin system VapC family toxin [Streptomyces sp. Li-HN-5-11]WNM35415.1 type II toxin-antitoxin system VapC family toxin [Streptomyces sp. Li-HN-5-11]